MKQINQLSMEDLQVQIVVTLVLLNLASSIFLNNSQVHSPQLFKNLIAVFGPYFQRLELGAGNQGWEGSEGCVWAIGGCREESFQWG